LDSSPRASRALERIRVVLCATSHPGNVGAAARAMKTMGLADLRLVAPLRFPDPEAEALASRATEVLAAARVCATLEEALAGCVASYGFTARPRQLVGRVLPVREAALRACAETAAGEVALVFGNETFGLSNEELDRCSALAYIPAELAYSSLNLAAAVQVACYEVRVAARAGTPWRAPRFPPATHEDLEQLYAHARRTLVDAGFLDPGRPRRLLPRLRRLFARTGLEHEEVNILRGILAAMDALVARAGGPAARAAGGRGDEGAQGRRQGG
jgi:tRNA/rRNA methyltransferase